MMLPPGPEGAPRLPLGLLIESIKLKGSTPPPILVFPIASRPHLFPTVSEGKQGRDPRLWGQQPLARL